MNVVIRVVLSGSESSDLAKHSKNGAMFLFSKFTTSTISHRRLANVLFVFYYLAFILCYFLARIKL